MGSEKFSRLGFTVVRSWGSSSWPFRPAGTRACAKSGHRGMMPWPYGHIVMALRPETRWSSLMEGTKSKLKTKVIAVGNQKGGVGKTSNTVHLATALAEIGRKCLVWDLDVNCGSTQHFGIPDNMAILGTYEVLMGAESPEEVIVRRRRPRGGRAPAERSSAPSPTKPRIHRPGPGRQVRQIQRHRLGPEEAPSSRFAASTTTSSSIPPQTSPPRPSRPTSRPISSCSRRCPRPSPSRG